MLCRCMDFDCSVEQVSFCDATAGKFLLCFITHVVLSRFRNFRNFPGGGFLACAILSRLMLTYECDKAMHRQGKFLVFATLCCSLDFDLVVAQFCLFTTRCTSDKLCKNHKQDKNNTEINNLDNRHYSGEPQSFITGRFTAFAAGRTQPGTGFGI